LSVRASPLRWNMVERSVVRAKVYSVSELNSEIKALLEAQYPFVWLRGETSNLRMPSSGHVYFTLKDDASQIQAVMFRGQNRMLKFRLEDGMTVVGLGRISVFEPRGAYQIIIEHLEPAGVGALQIAFERLKTKLENEGLFDPKRKRPLPFLPSRIALVTSPTGSVVFDMLQIIRRRFPGMAVDILPVKVQGDGADAEIADAIEWLNSLNRCEVAVLARGGGSLEDLQAFNSERVARAIAASHIPIVSAVGHETDYTIADFAADLRAPTPSAAAELVVPLRWDLIQKIQLLKSNLFEGLKRYIENRRLGIRQFAKRLSDPSRRIQDARLRLDELDTRLQRTFLRDLERRRERIRWRTENLYANNPRNAVLKSRSTLDIWSSQLIQHIQTYLSERAARLGTLSATLAALDPTAILSRGYSIARTIPEAMILRDSAAVQVGQKLELLLAKGSLVCRVKERS
jgi:exodeoxyribonuclease VII large subunit